MCTLCDSSVQNGTIDCNVLFYQVRISQIELVLAVRIAHDLVVAAVAEIVDPYAWVQEQKSL
jgi:hypothetical protein